MIPPACLLHNPDLGCRIIGEACELWDPTEPAPPAPAPE